MKVNVSEIFYYNARVDNKVKLVMGHRMKLASPLGKSEIFLVHTQIYQMRYYYYYNMVINYMKICPEVIDVPK